MRRLGVAVARRHGHLLGKGSGAAEPHESEGCAHTLLPPAAEFTAPATQARVDDDFVPHLRALNVLSHGRHHPSGIRAQNVGHLQLRARTPLAHPDIQVVQASTQDLEHDLSTSCLRLFDILDPQNVQVAVLVNHCCLHR